ncbi:MAG: pyridoxal-phosphate-dependent aminotransferase family protein, partial [Planctomycetota bacterium]
AALGTGEYDAVAFVHSETSTGVLNPLEAIAEVVREFDDVLLLVDAVSSVTTVPIEVDAHGVDALLFGVQKGVALPPGLACVAISERAHARAEQAENRGYYFDLLTYRKYHGRGQTPSTPAISQIMALRAQLARMRAEGLDARYARHRALTERAQAWALERGFGLFAEEGYRTFGLTAVRNDRGADVGAIAKRLFEEHDAVIDQGYGKIKHETFRIPHMGDMQSSELEAYLGWLDAALNG